MFLNHDYYLGFAGPELGVAVLIDTATPIPMEPRYLDACVVGLRQRLFDDMIVVVLPHTYGTDMVVRRHVARVELEHEIVPTEEPKPYDPSVPPDPLGYTRPVVIEASFQVTGLVRHNSWTDPSDLEAARALLAARYDLKLGIWDLAQNPTLRQTLLQSVPQPQAPEETAPVAPTAMARAKREVDKTMVKRSAQAAGLAAVMRRLEPLRQAGWTSQPGRPESLWLALTEAHPMYPGDEPWPLVYLILRIAKRTCDVSLGIRQYNQIDLLDYVGRRGELFEAIASPAESLLERRPWPTLWKESGGWMDEVDWEGRAAGLRGRAGRWIEALGELCAMGLDLYFRQEARSPNVSPF